MVNGSDHLLRSARASRRMRCGVLALPVSIIRIHPVSHPRETERPQSTFNSSSRTQNPSHSTFQGSKAPPAVSAFELDSWRDGFEVFRDAVSGIRASRLEAFQTLCLKTTAVSGVEGRLGMSRPDHLLQRECLSGHYYPGAMMSDSTSAPEGCVPLH